MGQKHRQRRLLRELTGRAPWKLIWQLPLAQRAAYALVTARIVTTIRNDAASRGEAIMDAPVASITIDPTGEIPNARADQFFAALEAVHGSRISIAP